MTDIGALYRRMLLDLWHADPADLPALAAGIVTDDFVMHQQRAETSSESVRGPAALVDLVGQARALFTGVRVTLDVGPIVEGDLVAARWTFRGRLAAAGGEVPPGTEMALSGHDIVRAGTGPDAGRFVEYWVCSDTPRPVT